MAEVRPGVADLYSIASNGAVDVAVGDHGAVYQSADGVHWKDVDTGYGALPDRLLSVIWAGDEFYVIGDHGLVLHSADGTHWQGTSPSPWGYFGTVESFTTLAAGGGLVVMADGPGLNLNTHDGTTWTAEPLNAVRFNAGSKLVRAAGQFYGLNGGLQHSADGLSGAAVKGYPGTGPCDIASDGTKLVVQDQNGHFYTTSDGKHWTGPGAASGVPCDSTARGLSWTGNEFVWVSGAATYYSSSDGLSWNSHSIDPDYYFRSMVWDGGQYIAVGSQGAIFTSPDGDTWTSRSGEDHTAIEGIAWDGSEYIADIPADSAVLVGSGAHWQTATPPTELNFVTFVNDKTYGSGNAINRAYVTSDGSTWTPSTEPLEYSGIAGDGAMQVVAITSGTVAVSNDDGATWSTLSKGVGDMTRLLWTGQEYLGVDSEKVWSSPDGVSWTEQTLSTPPDGVLLDVARGGGKYLITADGGVLYTSTDGAHWTKGVATVPGDTVQPTMRWVIWDGKEFIGVGTTNQVTGPYSSSVWVSEDGASWYPERVPSGFLATYVATGSGEVIIGGAHGELAVATPGQRGLPITRDVSVQAEPATTNPDAVHVTVAHFAANDPAGAPLAYMTSSGGSADQAGDFHLGITDARNGQFSLTGISEGGGGTTFTYMVGNDVVYSSPASIKVTETDTSGDGGGSGVPASGGGGGALGWPGLFVLISGYLARKRRTPSNV